MFASRPARRNPARGRGLGPIAPGNRTAAGAHFSFPKDVWADLFAQGRVVHHPVFPGKAGPAARRIHDESDVRDVIALLRLNYDRVIARHGLPEA
jgi:hypothetical protein